MGKGGRDMNITADIQAWVKANVSLYGAITIDNFGATSESLMVRGDPSNAKETPYLDGSAAGVQQLSFYARSKTPATAISALDTISKAIDLDEIAVTDALTITCRNVTTPFFVSKENSGESIYTFSATLEYYKS
jgi:hypothetical protein